MHILVTADTLGGVWTYTRELVTGLVHRGIRVTLVSFGDVPHSSETVWMWGLKDLDYRPTAFRLEWMQGCHADLQASSDYLRGVVEETRPDLLHLNQFFYGALPCEVPRLVVAHSDVVGWWQAVHGCDPPDSEWIRSYRELVCRGLEQADAVAAPTQWMAGEIHRNYLKPKQTTVINNGRSPEIFHPNLTRRKQVMSIGRLWDKGKNAALLCECPLSAPVVIAGSGVDPDSGSNLFHSFERKGIEIRPHQDQETLAQSLGRAAVYAATSRYEPFGLAPVEAALSGCAIVASDIPPFRELWEGAALFFRDNDPESLRATLEWVLEDPDRPRKYGDAALKRASERFHARRMVEAYLALYQALVPMGVVAA